MLNKTKTIVTTLIVLLVASVSMLGTASAQTPAGDNLVVNGSFEDVASIMYWDIYTSSEMPGWDIEWMNANACDPSDPVQEPVLELHEGGIFTNAQDGRLYAELDSDCQGKGGSNNWDETTTVRISQEIITSPGHEYEISFSFVRRAVIPEPPFAPVPGDQTLAVSFGGQQVFEAEAPVQWERHTVTAFADSGSMVLSLADTGLANSLGVFIDDVQVVDLGPPCEPDSDNLAINGSFEDVASIMYWDIYTSSEMPGWDIEWMNANACDPSDPVQEPVLELHEGGIFTNAQDGRLYAELDSDCQGKGGSNNWDETTTVRISQEIATVTGNSYAVSFSFVRRAFVPVPSMPPVPGDQTLAVSFGGQQVFEAEAPTDWERHTVIVTAQSDAEVLSFADTGLANSLGVFLDDVQVRPLNVCE